DSVVGYGQDWHAVPGIAQARVPSRAYHCARLVSRRALHHAARPASRASDVHQGLRLMLLVAQHGLCVGLLVVQVCQCNATCH
ncbi:hypothetical protein HAX54_029590, partial [Datura stramonium]|nr:hypothetical protein [Datura stramonium]